MNRPGLTILLLLLTPFSLMAQEVICDGNRYLNEVFVDVDSTKDVQYGQATTMAGKAQALLLDIYEPHGDDALVRPLIILAHGGSFISGDRSQTAELSTDFAKMGYVCANIEYRLLDSWVSDSTGMFEVVIMAINDMRAAVRYFKEDAANANTYRIDPESVFVAGVSAGAIMASHLGFLDPQDELPDYIKSIMEKHGGFEGNSSNNTQYKSNVQGTLNYSGGLLQISLVDKDDAPVYSAHDDMDPVVPCSYNTSNAVPFPVYIYGSCDITTAASQVNISNDLYMVPNSTGHVSYFYEEDSKKQVIQESGAFLEAIICNQTSSFQGKMAKPNISVYPNPFKDILYFSAEERVRSVTVTNLMGQVFLEQANPGSNHLDLSHLPGGLYLIRMETEEGTSIIKAVKSKGDFH